jgi:hypothetical protein
VTEREQAFLELAIARARQHPGVDLALPEADLSVSIVPVEGDTFRLTLHTLFATTSDRSPDDRAAALDARLDAALTPMELPADWLEAQPRLRTVLRSASTFGATLGELVAMPVLPGLVEAAVLDHPHAVLHVNRQAAADWGRSPTDVLLAARAATPPVELEPWDADAGLYCSDQLSGGAWALHRSDAPDTVFAVPHAHLLIVGPNDPKSVARLAATASAEYDAGGRPVSPCVYAPGPVRELRVPPSHPAFDALERARIQLWVDEVAATAHDVGVELRLAAARGPDGRLRTAVEWTDAESLPEAEVTLGGPAPEGERVPWRWPPWRRC